MPDTNKTIQQLNLEDDFLFAKVMSDKDICRKVLEKILGVSSSRSFRACHTENHQHASTLTSFPQGKITGN